MGTVLGEIGQWQTWLHNIANHLDDLEHRARTPIADADMSKDTPGG